VAADEEASGEVEAETNRIIPIYCSHALNERDFGALQGMHSKEQRRRFHLADLEHWRTAWDAKFPDGESSKDVYGRVEKFFEKHIRRQLDLGNNVMIVAHGFVQRCLMKLLSGMSDEDWVEHMKLESSPDPAKKRASKLLAKNAVPVIFSYSKGASQDDGAAVVRIECVSRMLGRVTRARAGANARSQHDCGAPHRALCRRRQGRRPRGRRPISQDGCKALDGHQGGAAQGETVTNDDVH